MSSLNWAVWFLWTALYSLSKSGCVPKPDAPTVQARKSLARVVFFVSRLYEQTYHLWHTGSWKQTCHSGHGWGMVGAWSWRSSSQVGPVTATWREEVHMLVLIQTSWTQQPTDCWRVTFKLCPEIGNSTRLPSWCLRICHYGKSYRLTWDRPEYLCTSPWQLQRQTGILAPVQIQHSPTSAACSITRLFCASLRVSKHHRYQHAHERDRNQQQDRGTRPL